ncbi:MAG: T9SS type A sorting domain-containing protein [Saprospiraceae bacterium]|nr:T9SS type A sorting domain-containing protein [Saprospiraceae bacterium]
MRSKIQALCFVCVVCVAQLKAQVYFNPVFPTADEPVTITYNPQEGDRGLAAWTGDIYAHTGVTTSAGAWQNVNATWGAQLPNRKFTRQTDGTYQQIITTSLRQHYGVAAGEPITAVSFVFHNGAGNSSISGRGTGGADIFYNDIIQPTSPLRVRVLNPSVSSQFTQRNGTIAFKGAASQPSTLTLTDNGIQIAIGSNTKELVTNIVAPNADGTHRVVFKATLNGVSDSSVFNYVVVPSITVANPPTGMELGANVNAAGDSITFLFQAPRKQNVFVIGSFNNYQADSKYLMNRSVDGNTWWVKIGGLTKGQTYTYQYLVDGTLRVADPLSMLVLDPNNDSRISAETYPNPIPYPSSQTSGFVSVITPGKATYNWQVANFQRPAKGNLVIYELLTRDFVAKHNYQTLIDTIQYLKNMGINAIELMPVTEFDNNESWGYNPTFHMALDKYYGTPDKFKEFIDVCHKNGIAVILDVVFNHIWGGGTPLAALYFEGGKPAADNPWLNPDAKHPYNVGYDMNHDSPFTKAYVERCLKFLLQEYKLDGFRFDLSKGLTQNAKCGGSTTDEACISRKDQTRIDILKNYHNTIQATVPGAYTILEHFCENSEETELAQAGMMLWANQNWRYGQISKGESDNGLLAASAKTRGWTTQILHDANVLYMESHDEERNMYRNLTEGLSLGSYNTRDLKTALRRQELASAFFYTIPGPKMLWQFGEVGYDIPINQGGRVSNKPILWNYFTETDRRRLYNVTANLIYLRTTQPVFQNINYDEFGLLSGRTKNFQLLNDPSMKVIVAGNLYLAAEVINLNFPNTGKWYDYMTGDSINVTNTQEFRTYLPGEYHIYTSVKLARPPMGYIAGSVGTAEFKELVNQFSVYPNPSVSGRTFVGFSLRKNSTVQWEVFNMAGQKMAGSALMSKIQGSYQDELDKELPNGIYTVRLTVDGVTATERLVVQK